MRLLARMATSELFLWPIGLLVLFLIGDDSGTSACLFRFLGVEHCWGCGLGHAVHEALHLHLNESIASHPLGIPILLILVTRILQLGKTHLKNPPTWTSNNY